jgi:two-component system cell cycle sensor histidine kinase PleC
VEDQAAMPLVLEALHCLRVGITLFDEDERLIFANRHYGYMFRSLPLRETYAGLSFEDLMRLEMAGGDIAPESVIGDRESFIKTCRARLFAGDFVPRDLPMADGRIIEIKVRRTPDRNWIGLWTDVTQARNNLERLNATIEMSADAFAFYDRNDRLTLCNGEYAAIAGVSAPQDIVGQSFEEVIKRVAPNAGGGTQEWLAKRRKIHGQPAGAMTVDLSDGIAYLVRDRAAADGGRIVVFTDVTEHRRAEKVLAEQTRALDDTRKALAVSKAKTAEQASYLADLAIKLDQTTASADSTKTTLLRTMSHELKTPLNAIIGFSDLLGTLADHAGPEQVREYAGLIHQGGRNLLRLINQILDLTKISAGRYELRRQGLGAGQALWEAKERHEGAAGDKNITVVCEPVDDAIAVDADEGALTLMLNHLVENAVTFTQPGGEVHLGAERSGDMVRLIVRDNGPGIAAADLARILEPFELGSRKSTEHHAGAGLGLTLVKAFGELHGGALTLESTAGEGFTAMLDLPAAK